MKAKLITLAMGAALLGSGTLAMAHDRDDHGLRNEKWREPRWHEHEWRHHHPAWQHEYYRYGPRWERYYVPGPGWHYRPSYPYAYDRDGVSIILRGHFN
jgi:hypothetical protein